jgi:hypothetical protein
VLAGDLLDLIELGSFGQVGPSLHKFNVSFKEKSFETEQEIRIAEMHFIHTNMNPDFPGLRTGRPGAALEYREGKSHEIVPYRCFPFGSPQDSMTAIHSIGLGPKNVTDPNFLQRFLEKVGVHVESTVYRSTSAYR